MNEPAEAGSQTAEVGERSTALNAPRRAAGADLEFSVLLVGNAAHREFRPAVELLERAGGLTIAADVAAALVELERGTPPPALVVIAQARPGEYASAEIDALRRAAPLAPFVALLGSWCEGETRSGSPWPGVVRVYWHQWRWRATAELAALRTGRRSNWSLPATASEEERLLASALQPFVNRPGLAAIAAENFAMADWLADACRAQGFAVIHCTALRPCKASGVEAVLWDAGLAAEANFAELETLRLAFPDARRIALADFPRIEHCERLLAAGATAVLSKPVLLAELASHFGEAQCRAVNR